MNVQPSTLTTAIGGTIQDSSVSESEGQSNNNKFLSRKVNFNQPSKTSPEIPTGFANSSGNSKLTTEYLNSKSSQSDCRAEVSQLTSELKKAKEELKACKLNKYASAVNSHWKDKISKPDNTISNFTTVGGSVTASSSSLSASGKDVAGVTSATTQPLSSTTPAQLHESQTAGQTVLPGISATSRSTATPVITTETPDSTLLSETTDATVAPRLAPSTTTADDKATSSASLFPEVSRDTASTSGKESNGASTTSVPGAEIHQSRTADQTTHSVMSATSDSTVIMPGSTAETQNSTSFTGTTGTASVLTTLTPSRSIANKTTSSANSFVGVRQSEAMVIAREKEIGNGTSNKSLPSPTAALINESRTSDQMARSTLSAANNSTTTPAISSDYTTEKVNSTTLPGVVNTAPVMTTIVPSPTTADNAISSSSPFSGAMLPNDTIIANQTFAQGVTNSTIIPATPLPTLQTLVAKGVESTLISKVARSLVKYQLQNPLEDLSAQTEFLEKVIEFYKVASLAIGLSSFARSIKASHPEIARKYEDKLKKITDEIKDAVKKESQGTHRSRRGLMEDMYKKVLQELYEFTKEPMSGDMLTFFKGFEAERELFTQHMSNPVGDTPGELKYLFDNMGTATSVIVAMDHYSLRIKDLLSKGLFEEVGKIALKVNVLYAVGTNLVKAGQWDSKQSLENPFKDLLAEFQGWKDVQIKALKTLSDTDPTTLKLSNLIDFSLVYDSLRAGRVGDELSEGFCWADTIALGIAAKYLKITDSLAMMAESVLYGIGYGKYALELRLILQELAFWSVEEEPMVNQAISLGIKKGSVYYKKLIERLEKLASTMDKAINSSTIESIDQFIEQFQKIYQAGGSPGLMQFMLAPNDLHAFYADIREIKGVFKLTISDVASGLHVATGKTIDALKESISQQMGSLLESYDIPLESTGEAVPKSGYVRLREDILEPLEDLQLFPDSALTIKDILSNPPEKLPAIDIANTQALIEKYLKTVNKKSNRDMFKADKQAENHKPGISDEMITVNDPIIAQMREVLAALRTANSSALTRHLSQQIKDLNAHILKTIDSYSKQVANPEKPASSSADAQQAGQESIALTEEEAIKLSIDYDFMKLVNPAARGLKMAQSQPGTDPVPESTSQEGGKLSDGTLAGGGIASFGAAVSGALVAFKASCPGCLTQMLSDLAESVQDMQLGQELPEVAKTLTKKAAQEAGKKAVEEGVEETGKKAVEDGVEEAGKKGLKEGAEDAMKKGLKKGGEEAAKKLVRCRRSGLCDAAKDLDRLKETVDDLKELAEVTELVAELDGAEDAGDTVTATVIIRKLGDWLGRIFGKGSKNHKSHKSHEGKDSDNHMTVGQLVNAVHLMTITPAPAVTSPGLTSGAATGKATARDTDSGDNSERTTKPTTRPKTTKATTPKTTEATTAETTPETTTATTPESETTDTTARSSGNRTDTTPATTTKISQLSITDAVSGNGTTTQPETTPGDTSTLAPGPDSSTSFHEPMTNPDNSSTRAMTNTEPATGSGETTTIITPTDRNTTQGTAVTTDRTSSTIPATLSSTAEPTARTENNTTPVGNSTEPATDDTETKTIITPADRKTTQGTTRTTAGTITTEPASSTVKSTGTPVNSAITARPIVLLANWARQITDRFDAEIGKAMNTTLESIDQLHAASAKRRSVQKRVLIGDALNTLNDRFDERFLKVFEQAHRASAGSSGDPVADDKLITLFQQMYVSVCEQRMRLFVDAGYIDTGNLSQEEILQLRSAALDEDGKVVLSPSRLIDVINDTLKTSEDDQPFDEFLNQLLGTLENKSRPTRLAPPATDLINSNQQQGRQQLGKVLEGEKERFIDDIQALHLRDNSHYSDEVFPSGQDVLFLPSTFLDVIKDPDAYRGVFDREDTRYRQLDFDPLHNDVNMMGAGKTPKPVVTKDTTAGQPSSTDSSTTRIRQLKDYPSLPDPVMPLSDRAREVTNRFDSEISKDIDRTRENIQHLSAGSARQRSIQKRVLLGDGLNTLSDRFESRFLAVFEQAHRASSSTAAAFTDGELTAIFEQMYSLLCEERIQLFVDVGYIDAGNLSQKEILQLKSGAYDKDGNVVLSPQHLSRVIGDTLREFEEHNPFSEFLNHLLTRLGQRPGLTEPVREPGTHHNHNNPETNGPMLADILKREKNLFIADVQKIYLRDSGHFEDEISLDGAPQDVLFLPSTFLDVIKEPDAYRAIFDGTQRYDGQAKESGIDRSRKRRDIDQSPAPASSSAARPGGVIGNIGRYLGGLRPATASVPDKSPAIASESQAYESPASAFTRSAQLHGVGNLALATLLASRFNNRQIETGQRTIAENQDLLSQSPGMRLLSDSSAIAWQLGAEVRAFVDHLNDSDQAIAADWSLNDLVNMAIMQTTTKKSTNVAEAFLDEVLKSPQIGVEHERPENIFEADGRVRGKADSGQSLFHDPKTGKTDTTGPIMGLARAMLQAMARRRLSGQDYDLTDSQRREIIQQVHVLADRQKTSDVAGLAKFIGLGGAKASPADIADILDERLTDKSTILTPQHDPLINLLDRGDYVGGKKLFVQLSPDQLLEKVESLASEPDYLGIDYSAGLLTDLRAEMLTSERFSDSGEKPNLNRSFSRQRAWELFTNLYDSKIAAQKEAFDRVKIQAMIHRHGIRDISEASHLSQLLVQLQPVRASASDYVGALQQSNTSPGIVKLHQFDLKRTAGMIKHYLVLRDFVDKRFAQTFGSAVTDPQLRAELVSHVARISLDALKGNIHSGSWEVIAGQNLKDEHDEFVTLGGNDVDVLY